jgi:hypothetical protein
MKYFCHSDFGDLPEGAWNLLVDRVLKKATHLEVSRMFLNAPFFSAFATAEVLLPENIRRPYVATNRFLLTPEVVVEVKNKTYQDWDNYDSEDPAFYQDNVLLLGAITHEDIVIVLLDEMDRGELNNQGFDFWCEWSLD